MNDRVDRLLQVTASSSSLPPSDGPADSSPTTALAGEQLVVRYRAPAASDREPLARQQTTPALTLAAHCWAEQAPDNVC